MIAAFFMGFHKVGFLLLSIPFLLHICNNNPRLFVQQGLYILHYLLITASVLMMVVILKILHAHFVIETHLVLAGLLVLIAIGFSVCFYIGVVYELFHSRRTGQMIKNTEV